MCKGDIRVEHRILSRKEEVELAKRIEDGDKEAKNKLIEHNLRLVASIAREKDNMLSYNDNFQNGVEGLIAASEKFDYRKGYKFSTYANRWIRQNINRNNRLQGMNIVIPEHFWYRDDEESRVKINNRVTKSLNIENKDDNLRGSSEMINIIEDRTDYYQEIEQGELLDILLQSIDERSRRILDLRFGLYCPFEHTLTEVSKIIGLSRERIRQLQKKSIEKMRLEFTRMQKGLV